MSRKRREATTQAKVENFVSAAQNCKSAQEAAVKCGFSDTEDGASSWKSTYSTMRKNMIEGLVKKGATLDAAETFGYKKLPLPIWGKGAAQVDVCETFGISPEEAIALGIATADKKENKKK